MISVEELPPEVKDFTTPGGSPVKMAVRSGTSDHNTVLSAMNEDEYRLRGLELHGTALDIGAHIGAVTVSLALDNPDLHVIAVEALSANVEVLRQNVERNGVSDRVTIIHGAAGKAGRRTATVRWNFTQNETGQHHRFIGNAQLGGLVGEHEKVTPWSLPDQHITFAKIDCELCEYDLLTSPWVKRIDFITGEFHNGFEPIVDLLNDTHLVRQTGGSEAFGHFEATAR